MSAAIVRGPAHHRPRPHAQGPSAPPGVDALAPHRLGRAPSARRPPPSSRPSSPTARTPSRATAPASGILRLAKRYGAARLEAACARAVAVGARSYRHVDSILKHGLDRLAAAGGRAPAPALPPTSTSAGRRTTRTRSRPRRATRARRRRGREARMSPAHVWACGQCGARVVARVGAIARAFQST